MAIEAHMMYGENFGFALDNVSGFDNLCFVPQQQQQQQSMAFSHQKDHSYFPENNIPQPMAFSQSFSAHFEKQRMEIDQFINSQNEGLRQAIHERRKHEIWTLMKKLESKAQFLLKQKEEEIGKASNRAMELETLLKRIEIENQTWQRVAKEKEVMIGSLNGRIQRLRETNAAEDAQSCCQNAEKEEIKRKMICKCCNSRKSCVIILPCRHLCSCRDCELFLHSCPVCTMVKEASIEAFF